MADITFKYGSENTDFLRVTAMLSESYWVPGVAEDTIRRAFENSAVVAAGYDGDYQMCCCRAVSDKTRFAYIMDVYVDEHYRRKGYGQRMLKFLLGAAELKTVRHIMLLTRDAHTFYEKVGFSLFSRPLDLLEIRKGTW
ncbi:MAG: GNAT family N-acetyltransferase [Oscillospiraceae bacterium]|jgi:N-acetylglutamate synthase-like GNAT family acetyltransferase|nr:GNAT family N-acetyltransferase [Oscillospiraceae bacterium]